jgi:hypothetical protein
MVDYGDTAGWRSRDWPLLPLLRLLRLSATGKVNPDVISISLFELPKPLVALVGPFHVEVGIRV